MPRRILKLTLGREAKLIDGLALMTGRNGSVVGFWHVTEPEVKRCFDGRNYAYFFAEGEGERMNLAPAPDQDW